MQIESVRESIVEISNDFAESRAERQGRRELDPDDFARLADAGFLLTGIPVASGGVWDSPNSSTRAVAEMLRTLARSDSSLALVAAMHPAVIAFTGWLTVAEAPAPYTERWADQREWAFNTARKGAWWGTITSEPGSGGDVMNTRAKAVIPSAGENYLLTGEKHFGSGSGVTSYMITTAVPVGEPDPDIFILDMQRVPWDGSKGVTLRAPWDGHGMTATQSHAFTFESFPARRLAWPDLRARMSRVRATSAGLVAVLFTAVIAGIADVALSTARAQLKKRHESMRAFEQVEWSRAEIDGWLINQAYEGMLRDAEQGNERGPMIGKEAIAELAETMLGRICRVLGGGTFSRQSPFGLWFEDVRALGFLRPPWGLAFDSVFAGSWR
jgi:alkylation response protein AidB-like acyl-CoA dehydrogenase